MTISERLFELSKAGPMGLYSDIDGTISRIALTPSSAAVEPKAIVALERIRKHGVHVVAISGRAATDAHALLGLDSITYAGNHGFEMLTPTGRRVTEAVERATRAVSLALSDVREALPMLPEGILVEDKTYTGSVHYRLAPDQLIAEGLLRPLLTEVTNRHGLVLTEGRLVFEIRPNLRIDKGVFTAADIRLNQLRTAAFLGDDITDLDGFKAIQESIASGALIDGACIGVRAPESAQRVIDESDMLADDVGHLCEELSRFAERLSGQRS